MRWVTVIFALFLAFLAVGWTNGSEPTNSTATLTTEARLSSAEAIPIMPETFENVTPSEFMVPTGWFVEGANEDGVNIRHTDGARATIVQTENDDSYQVAWHVIYSQDGLQCVSAGAMRVDGPAPRPGEVGIAVNEQPDGRLDVEAIVAPWPDNVGQSLVGQLNPATRQGICTR